MAKNMDGGTMKLVFGVIGVVVLFYAAPELWTILDGALNAIATANIPLISGMTGVIGLVFGAVVLIGGLIGLFALFKNKAR